MRAVTSDLYRLNPRQEHYRFECDKLQHRPLMGGQRFRGFVKPKDSSNRKCRCQGFEDGYLFSQHPHQYPIDSSRSKILLKMCLTQT